MSIERPNYGTDYVVNSASKDFNVDGTCHANKSERSCCKGNPRILDGCYFYNLFTGKCMRPEDIQEGAKK